MAFAFSNASGSLASSISVLSASVVTNSASLAGTISTVSTVSSSLSGVLSEYVLKVSAGNRVAGFKLLANSSTSSSFIVEVDQFKIVKPDGTGTIVPFEVDGSSVKINNAYIKNLNASVITAGTISADKIGAGTISAAISINSPTITGGTLNIGSGVFQVASNGNITSTGGTIGGWTIGATTLTGGSTTLNSNGTITCADLQASTGGKIGGWTISSTTLTGGNITLNSTGNVYAGMTGYDTGTGWYLANDGKFSVGNSGGNKLVWDGSKLKVTGGIYVTDSIGIRNDGSSTLTITGGPSNASGGQIDLTPSGIVSLVATGGQYIQFYAGGAQRGFVQSDGKFDWLGTSEFDGAMTVNSTVAATSFNSTSSRKYKTNIRNLTNGLNIINNLRPVMFDWNNKDIKNDIGMIAEEVNEILPTIVYKNSNGEIDGLEYGKLVAVLTTAVKELSAEVQELKRQINELKK